MASGAAHKPKPSPPAQGNPKPNDSPPPPPKAQGAPQGGKPASAPAQGASTAGRAPKPAQGASQSGNRPSTGTNAGKAPASVPKSFPGPSAPRPGTIAGPRYNAAVPGSYTPIVGQSKKTSMVQQRLQTAEKMVRQGNLAAAVNYANAALNIQKTGIGLPGPGNKTIGSTLRARTSLDKVQNIVNTYTDARNRANVDRLFGGGEVLLNPGGGTGAGNPTTTTTNGESDSSGGYGGYGDLSATPDNIWTTESTYKAPTGVKQATPDIIVFDQTTVDIKYLTEEFFEEFGGHELIKISRSDLIDGKEVAYNPIKNLSILNQKYNPNTVIAIAPFQQNLSLYAIDLILRGIHEPYIDRESGNLVIEIDNVKSSESIEVEIAIGGTMNRVIYDY